MLIKQHELVQKNGTKAEQLTAAQALDRHLAAPLEEIFESPFLQKHSKPDHAKDGWDDGS